MNQEDQEPKLRLIYQLNVTLMVALAVLCLHERSMGQTFTDNFGTYHDYTSGDVTGTMWDGVLNAQNLISPSDTSNGVLNWITSGTGWENPYNGWTNGPFLYKLVSGDFDAQVYVASASTNEYDD